MLQSRVNVAGIDMKDPHILDEEAELLEIELVTNIFNLNRELDTMAVQCSNGRRKREALHRQPVMAHKSK